MAPKSPPTDPRVVGLHEIVSRIPPSEIEKVLSGCGITPLPEVAEAVLRRSYSSPAAAVRFFRWSGQWMKHTPYAWNLMVDILGKNALFEAMWDAIRSMRNEEGALSVATFASAFSSYCSAGRFKEAIMTFDVMERYGVPQDVIAVNSLMSAVCRQNGHTSDAADFVERIKAKIPPDGDSFAILLEGWEKEGNIVRAKSTFGEMVVRVGWSPDNMPAYDAFLTTLVRAGQADEAIKFLRVMKEKGCLPGLKFFMNALDILVQKRDSTHASLLWDIMVADSGLIPNLQMYNSVVVLCCENNNLDFAYRLLDDMPFSGVFPDSVTYNAILECLVRNKKAREAESFLTEMRKNEQLPSVSACASAIKMFFEEFDPTAAKEVWDCVVEERIVPADDCAAELLEGLLGLKRLSDARRYAEDMVDMRIELRLSSLQRMKSAFYKAGKHDWYNRIDRRLKHPR